jgi:hypothetical protein
LLHLQQTRQHLIDFAGTVSALLLPVETPGAVRRLLRRCLAKDARLRLHDIADARLEIQATAEPSLLLSHSEFPAEFGGLPVSSLSQSLQSLSWPGVRLTAQ